ncbi:MAG: efflux RND transporter periplasmic adaptor subunit [Pseudomonadota bacterium]|nr:efflux RND transporter periplasmic adaptor subunit [Pseudomonadota bacterium]
MRRKTLLWIVVAVALAGGVYWLVAGRGGEPPAQTAAGPPQGFALPVEAAPVRVGTVTYAVEAVGTLRANEAVAIRPEVDGRIEAIHFDEGQAVRQGAPLVSLDASVYDAELDQAQARLALSRTSNQRLTSLRQRGLGTEQEQDQTQAELRVNQAALALAQARLAKTAIVAPFAGVLGLRQVSVGDYVTAGQNLVNLLDLDPIKVDFRVPEVFLAEVRTGQPIEISVDAFPGETFTGEVYAIDPQVDVNGRSLVLRARVPNPDSRLQAGLFARVSLILERRQQALLVPEDAIVPQGDKQFVYRVVDGKAALTEVGIGRRQGGEVEIVQGLTPEATVVTAGQLKIRDGAPVAPVGKQEG